MNRLPNGNNGGVAAVKSWIRRIHRWFGVVALLFILLLGTTGIALNHSDSWQLDQRYLRWSWLLAMYGIEAPPPAASFGDGSHRATLLGSRLYVNGRELARDVGKLAGLIAVAGFVVIAAGDDAFILTSSGEVVERLDLAGALPAGIDELGVAGDHVLVRSRDAIFRFDESLMNLQPLPGGDSGTAIRWSAATAPPAGELAAIEGLYLGTGVSVERLLADLHSGRLFTRLGPLVMDAAGVLLILLGVSGLTIWLQRGTNGNGNRRNGTRH